MVRGAFRASLDALRRGADAMPTDGGTDIDGTIDGYQALLDEIGDEASTLARIGRGVLARTGHPGLPRVRGLA